MIELHFGSINSIDVTKNTAKVLLPELDNKITNPLPILVDGSKGDKEFFSYREGTQVACLIIGNKGSGVKRGVILGTWFTDSSPCPAGTAVEKKIWEYPGGRIELDKNTGNLIVNLMEKIIVTVPELEINGNIIINGDIEQTGGITSSSTINSNSDVTTKGVSLFSHPHPYTDNGSPATTGAPVASLVKYLSSGFKMIKGWINDIR